MFKPNLIELKTAITNLRVGQKAVFDITAIPAHDIEFLMLECETKQFIAILSESTLTVTNCKNMSTVYKNAMRLTDDSADKFESIIKTACLSAYTDKALNYDKFRRYLKECAAYCKTHKGDKALFRILKGYSVLNNRQIEIIATMLPKKDIIVVQHNNNKVFVEYNNEISEFDYDVSLSVEQNNLVALNSVFESVNFELIISDLSIKKFYYRGVGKWIS